MITQIELRLLGASVPGGEITVKDLTGIASALQELVTRLARDTVNATGPGRSKQFVEEFAELRVGGVTEGSTVVHFSKGPLGKLDIDLPDLVEADDKLWEIFDAISSDTRPAWSSDLIVESAGKLAGALRTAAREVVIASPSRAAVHLKSAEIHLETWTSKRVEAAGVASAAGRLEKVDLRSHEFRLRDDVDNTVELKRVQNDVAAARLVGQWVVAKGEASLNASGRVVSLDHAKVNEVIDPGAEFLDRRVVPLEEILSSAPGPDPKGGIELTDEEFAEFMKAIRS